MRSPRRPRVARGAGPLAGLLLVVGCGGPAAPTSDDLGVGDVLGGDDALTVPLVPETVQVGRDGSEVVVTCGAEVCRWPIDGGVAEAGGVGGDALVAAAGWRCGPTAPGSSSST